MSFKRGRDAPNFDPETKSATSRAPWVIPVCGASPSLCIAASLSNAPVDWAIRAQACSDRLDGFGMPVTEGDNITWLFGRYGCVQSDMFHTF